MTNEFKLHDTVEFSETMAYTIFEINGKFYRIWHYADSDKKVLQSIVGDFDDSRDICVFQ